ncbi:MAG: hypothetical protein GXO42_01705 [bacterium]|nr:hypothetical protein [bacterium]
MCNLLLVTAGIIFTALSALNAYFWGLLKNQYKLHSITVSSLLKLVFNPLFFLILLTGFLATLCAYFIVEELGVIGGRFFQVIGLVATVLVGLLVFHEQLKPLQWLGACLILAGVLLLVSS